MTKISRVVQGTFALIFGMTILSAIARGFVKFNPLHIVLCIIFGILFTVGCVWLYGFLRKKTFNMSQCEINKIFFCISATVLIFQIISAFVLKFEPVSDLNFVDTAARDFSVAWDKTDLYTRLPERHLNYFARYTNNQALLVMLSLIYSVCDTIIGAKPLIVPVLINTIGLNISFILMYFISRKIFKDRFTPLFCAIIGSFFSVFYTYTPYFYTDSLSMPFAIGSIYLFLCGTDGKMSAKKAVQLFFSTLLLIIGFKIKGSVIILLPAFLLYLAVTLTKVNRKTYIKAACVFLTGITVSLVACSGFIKSFDIANESELEEFQFPPEHWVMMGLHDRGGFYNNDYLFTVKSGDYSQKKEANVKMIKDRLLDYGILGMAKHLAKKLSYTWGDGTYFIGYYMGLRLKNDPESSNVFKNFIVHNGLFKFFCTIYQCMLLFMILFSFISGAISKHSGKEIIFKIIICGVFFFFALWETRSRYLVNFTPVFIMTSTYSLKVISAAVKRRMQSNKINIDTALKNVG